jgi:hypothetical protein
MCSHREKKNKERLTTNKQWITILTLRNDRRTMFDKLTTLTNHSITIVIRCEFMIKFNKRFDYITLSSNIQRALFEIQYDRECHSVEFTFE